MGQLVLDKLVKFHDPSLSSSREIPPEAVGGGKIDCFPYSFRPEVDNDVISGMAVANVSMDVPIKFGDSRSNSVRDIRGATFMSNEHWRSLSQ